MILNDDIETLARALHIERSSCEWSSTIWERIPFVESRTKDGGCDTCRKLAQTLLDSEALITRETYESNRNPALVRIEEKIQAAVSRGYTEGDVNHNIQPVIGSMRLKLQRTLSHGGTSLVIGVGDLEHWIGKLANALVAEDAWLNTEIPE